MEHTNSKQAPRIWLVIGDKPGDNAQVEIIAEALGLPFEIRRVLPKKQYVLGKPGFKASLYHLDLERSDKLEPPWPDVILTIGRRPCMAALWIQAQSGGLSRIVLIGRPKRWMERFSLIIVPSQYRMPDDPKVLQLDFPLMRGNKDAIARAAEDWREHFANLPRPVTALMIGGQTKPFRFDADAARELLDKATAAAGSGFLYLTTSRRTPPAVIETLKENLPDNARLYCWSPDNQDNPYQALLALADQFIVTGDSISMMIEVARLGKPLAIYALPYQKGVGPWLKKTTTDCVNGALSKPGIGNLFSKTAGLLRKAGMLRYSRDLTTLHQLLYNQKFAVPLGTDFLPGGKKLTDELNKVTKRVYDVLPAPFR